MVQGMVKAVLSIYVDSDPDKVSHKIYGDWSQKVLTEMINMCSKCKAGSAVIQHDGNFAAR